MREVELKLRFTEEDWEKFKRIKKHVIGNDRVADSDCFQFVVQSRINNFIRDYVFKPKKALRKQMQLKK